MIPHCSLKQNVESASGDTQRFAAVSTHVASSCATFLLPEPTVTCCAPMTSIVSRLTHATFRHFCIFATLCTGRLSSASVEKSVVNTRHPRLPATLCDRQPHAFAVSTIVRARSSRQDLSTDGKSLNLELRARDINVLQFIRDTCEKNMPKLICNVLSTATYNTFGFLPFSSTWSLPSSYYTEIDATISNLTPNQQYRFHVHT